MTANQERSLALGIIERDKLRDADPLDVQEQVALEYNYLLPRAVIETAQAQIREWDEDH